MLVTKNITGFLSEKLEVAICYSYSEQIFEREKANTISRAKNGLKIGILRNFNVAKFHARIWGSFTCLGNVEQRLKIPIKFLFTRISTIFPILEPSHSESVRIVRIACYSIDSCVYQIITSISIIWNRILQPATVKYYGKDGILLLVNYLWNYLFTKVFEYS